MELDETDFLDETVLWKSFWAPWLKIVLSLTFRCCLAMSYRAACYFQHPQSFTICFNTFHLQTLWPVRKHRKLSPPILPYENVCVCSTVALFFSLISPTEKWNLQQWSCGIISLYCLILQILLFNYLLIYIPSIDLCFLLWAKRAETS